MSWKDKGAKSNKIVIMTGLIASFLASALLLDFRNIFYVDWNNQLWLIEYFGEFIKHWKLPDVINTQQLVGMPLPLFYGQKFFALAGVLSAFLGSAITIRILIFVVFLMQFFQVYRAAMKAGSTKVISIGTAVMVTWAIYPLTNLYNRCALTEFFAVAFLTCSVASFLSVIIIPKAKVSRYDIVASGLFFVAAAITHPLTAVFGGLFLGILGLIVLVFCEQERKPWFWAYFLTTAFFTLLILSPWVYILHQFNDKLTVFSRATNAEYFQSKYFFPQGIDNIFSRLSPFPLDLKAIQDGVQDQNTRTPYLDAQISIPLMMLIGVLVFIGLRKRAERFKLSPLERALIWGAVVTLSIAFIESVCPKTFDWLGGFFNTLQFPYRLISYVNLSALVILIILASRITQLSIDSKQIIHLGLAICIAVSFSALLQKLVHAAAIAQKSTKVNKDLWAPLPFGSDAHLNELPPTYYSPTVYSINDGFDQGTLSGPFHYIVRNFNVLDGFHFGQVEPLTISLTEPSLVITNVQPFPWNHIMINGSSEYSYSIFSVNGLGAVYLPQGSYHLEFANQTDGIWKTLNLLSWVLLLGWIVILLVFAFSEREVFL